METMLARVLGDNVEVANHWVSAGPDDSIDRRRFLKLTAQSSAALVVGLGVLGSSDSARAQVPTTGFLHGVASGDPLPDSVIIWTRLTPSPEATPGSNQGAPASVTYQVSRVRTFSPLIASGDVLTSAASDHTIKVDVAGLSPSTNYFYRFLFNGLPSPVGQTRTAPAPGVANSSLRFGVVSCSNFEGGYFAAYRHLARRTDLDFVLHLGDYIYEYQTGRYGPGPAIGRVPDLLLEAVREFDANGDGTPGDFLTPEGLIDITKFDAQGHRGSRNLRPENTLPAMEAALDHLMTTLEFDSGITADGVPLLSHDPHIQAQKCRRVDGQPYEFANEILIKDFTVAQIQSTFRCDKLFRGPSQQNDPALSPATVAFFAGDASKIYVLPTLQQVFDFVKFYEAYYRTGAGAAHPEAMLRWKNAARVRFNIETKINPRRDTDNHGQVFATRTIGPRPFARRVARVIAANQMTGRADIQSFDFRTLLVVHEQFPAIRTVCLFGDFPKYADPTIAGSDDGTNLQDENGANTPWLAGLPWPYRVTRLTRPFRAQGSGGFEGMALTADCSRLLPLLEKPLIGGESNTLLIHEFNLATKSYTGARYKYLLEPRGAAIGDFIMFDTRNGLVIERDNTQGDLHGFKAIFEITLNRAGEFVSKRLATDLLRISDPHRISEPAQPGDVGLGRNFAFPFVTIEDVLFFDRKTIGVLNDNNFPFSVGRHTGSGQPDDNEFIILKLDKPLKSGDRGGLPLALTP